MMMVYMPTLMLVCLAFMPYEVHSASHLDQFKKIDDTVVYVGFGGTMTHTTANLCALYTILYNLKAFQFDTSISECRRLVSVPGSGDMKHSAVSDLYIRKDSLPAPEKNTACIAVALDVSESLDDPSHLVQEASLLNKTWKELTKQDRLADYAITVRVVPFKAVVVTQDVKTIASDDYESTEAFLAAEVANVQVIMQDVLNTATSGLTDLSAALQYVIDLNCTADVRLLLVISDFIITLNPDLLQAKLDALKDAEYKVVAVALDKERVEAVYEQVGRESGLYVDMKGDYEAQLTNKLDSVFQ